MPAAARVSAGGLCSSLLKPWHPCGVLHPVIHIPEWCCVFVCAGKRWTAVHLHRLSCLHHWRQQRMMQLCTSAAAGRSLHQTECSIGSEKTALQGMCCWNDRSLQGMVFFGASLPLPGDLAAVPVFGCVGCEHGMAGQHGCNIPWGWLEHSNWAQARVLSSLLHYQPSAQPL